MVDEDMSSKSPKIQKWGDAHEGSYYERTLIVSDKKLIPSDPAHFVLTLSTGNAKKYEPVMTMRIELEHEKNYAMGSLVPVSLGVHPDSLTETPDTENPDDTT